MNGLKESATWFGDLDDDCAAYWHGLFLRAEAMDYDYWWWAVHDLATGKQLDTSTEKPGRPNTGFAARIRCEAAARHHIEKQYGDFFQASTNGTTATTKTIWIAGNRIKPLVMNKVK